MKETHARTHTVLFNTVQITQYCKLEATDGFFLCFLQVWTRGEC